MNIRVLWVVTICYLVSGCSLNPSRPLSEDFGERARSASFSALVKQRFHEDENLQRYVENYWVEEWQKTAGGEPVYRLQTDTSANLAISELDKMLNIFCRARGFDGVTTVQIPRLARGKYGAVFTGDRAQGVGCSTEDRIVAGYLKEGAFKPYILRIYGDTDSLAVMVRRKSDEENARTAKAEARRKWLEEESSRLRAGPRLNELVYVNLAQWRLDEMAGYELMDTRVARSRATFEGRVREVRPPMVLIENAVLGDFPRVWVPLESLEAPSHRTPYD